MAFQNNARGRLQPTTLIGTLLKITFHYVTPLPLTEATVLAIPCKLGQPKA